MPPTPFFFFSEDYILTDGQHKLEHQSSGTGEGQDFVKYLEAEVCILNSVIFFFFP